MVEACPEKRKSLVHQAILILILILIGSGEAVFSPHHDEEGRGMRTGAPGWTMEMIAAL
jgi:hypothetical protein